MKSKGRAVVVIGATSGMAREAIRLWAAEGARLALWGRNKDELEVVQKDATSRGAEQCEIWLGDLSNANDDHDDATWRDIAERMGRIDVVLIAAGMLPNQQNAEKNLSEARDALRVNGEAVAIWMLRAAETLEKQRSGCVGVITSVAGMRGRASNNIYGAAKGMLIRLLEGQRIRLEACGVRVLDLRPGFVSTAMTVGMKENKLFISAPKAGKILKEACERKSGVVFVPGRWRWIMLALIHVPYAIFKKLKI